MPATVPTVPAVPVGDVVPLRGEGMALKSNFQWFAMSSLSERPYTALAYTIPTGC